MPTKHSQFRRRMMALADGGHVRGPGSGTSDSIPARLSDGEFVLPADTVREVGVKSLRDLVSATHQPSGKPAHPARFADGGLVDDERQRASSLQKFDIGAWEQQMNQDRAAYTQKSLAQGQAAMEQAQANAEAAAAARPTDGGVIRAGAGVPAAPSPAAPAGTGLQGLADRIAQIPTGGPKAPAADGSQNSWANTEVGRNLTNLANALPGAAGNMVGQAARSGGAISNAISSGSLALGGVSAGAALGAASTAAAAEPAAAGQKPLPAGVSPSTAGAGRGSINPPAVDPSRPLSSTAAVPSDGASPGYGPIGDRTTLTNEQAAIMNPAGRITVTRGANGSMEFSGGNVSGQVSYNDASGKALAGGGLNGKGFSAFDVAPAGGTVATGPNGSYAFAERGESQAFVQLEDGRGRIECGFFNEQWQEFAPLLTRDRILVVEGGLREDEFNGGYSLRASRCWDFAQICGQQAQRISIRIDLRVPGAQQQLEQVLKAHAGPTPVLLEVATTAGIGRLTLPGGRGLQVDASLPGLLRSLPGVGTVQVQLARPWTAAN